MEPYLTVSGSPHPDSANSRLLASLATLTSTPVRSATPLDSLPIFQPARDQSPWPEPVINWRKDWAGAKAVIISTPAYLDNLPGVLKNALDWLTTSGVATGKPVLALTFCPHPPRGEHALQSLLWSLQALDCRVVAQLPCFQNEVAFDEGGGILPGDTREMLTEALRLLP
ncbi:NAD(P)H-dependent FMN reductase [Lewinella marina]|uniref:NADPH-dependent FMN reductase n=1 Tax=Neolewinella marina TaxID=438751 RepID=UPI001431262C|nr:NAD(P)H-dependent oxidoreductase [Neolewinella marina]NJB85594.1 NAD(P)H-dependent FMN reductase [Neolewinella marina]